MQLEADVIYCDDVRIEATGKHILIGVYSVDMVVGVPFPAIVGLTVYLRLWGLTAGQHIIDLTVSPPGAPAVEMKDGTIEITNELAPLTAPIGPIPLQIGAPGEILTSIIVDGVALENKFPLLVSSSAPTPA
jgi:hypothetical protein